MKKVIAVILMISLALSAFAGERLDNPRTGFVSDVYATASLIRGTDFTAGAGLFLGMETHNLLFGAYCTLDYVFNPGGNPYYSSMEMIIEPGIKVEWKFLETESFNTVTSLVLDFAYIMDFNKYYASTQNTLNRTLSGFMISPGLCTQFFLGKRYNFALSIFYSMMVYPSTATDLNGFGLLLKFY